MVATLVTLSPCHPVFLCFFLFPPLSTVMAETDFTTGYIVVRQENYFTVVSCWSQARQTILLWCLVGVRQENLFHCGVLLGSDWKIYFTVVSPCGEAATHLAQV